MQDPRSVPVRHLGRNPQRPSADRRWWLLPSSEQHAGVQAVVTDLDRRDQERLANNLAFHRLYENRYVSGRSSSAHTHALGAAPGTSARLTYNVVESCVDTAASKIARARPRPKLETVDGDYSLRLKAELLQAYVDGAFTEGNVYEESQRSFIDAAVFGTGVLFLGFDRDRKGRTKLVAERVHPDEIGIDEDEGRYGDPSQLHRRRFVLRDRLVELFPDKEEEIRSARGTRTQGGARHDESDEIETTESWHLPSSPEAGDGKRAITIDGCTLLSEPYTLPFFPFEFFHWKPPISGFWGQGLAFQLEGIQDEIDQVIARISAAQRNVAFPIVVTDTASVVDPVHLSMDPRLRVRVLRVRGGRPPQFLTPQAMNAEAYQYLQSLYDKAYEISGISQMTATAQKPGGLDSGVALREYSDIASERFQLTGQRWEQFFLSLARKVIDLSRDRFTESKSNRDLSVTAKTGRFVRRIRWREVDMDEDRYQLTVTAASQLPTSPAARRQEVQELVNAGFVSKEDALDLLQMPDLDRFVNLQTASLRYIQWTIGRILNDGEPGEVNDILDLQAAIRHGNAASLNAETEGRPTERIELLNAWVDRLKDRVLDEQGSSVSSPSPIVGAPVASSAAPTAVANDNAQLMNPSLPAA